MSSSRIHAGAIVRLNRRPFRLLRKLPNDLWQLENTATLEIIQITQEDLLAQLADGSLVFTGPEILHERGPIMVLDGPNHRIAKARLEYVLAVSDIPLTRAEMQTAIGTVWERIKYPLAPPSSSTVYRWRSRYLTAHRDFRVLANNCQAKGNRTYRFSDDVVSVARSVVHSKYLSRERATIQATYEEAIRQIHTINRERPDDPLQLPTRRLIKRLIDEIPAFDVHVARYGHDSARRTFRSVNGHIVSERPLDRAEIDHTVLDLLVLDDATLLPLGRPYITVCIDHFTRCVLGIFISFHPPSFYSVAMCLIDCFRPKTWIKASFPEIQNEWPAFGIMNNLVLDNGLEFHSASLEQASLSLGIVLSYAPRRVAWFKGTIERVLGTINRSVAHVSPGTCFANILERGDYDPEKHAVITLSTLELIIRKFIADVYHQQNHSALNMSPGDMWRNNIVLEEIRVPDETTNLEMILARFERRKLTHKGVEYAGLFYNSPELASLRHQHGPTLEVDVRVNDANLGTAFVTFPPTGQIYTVPALRRDYAEGTTLYQHHVFQNWVRRNSDLGTGPSGWLKAKEDIARIIEASITIKRRKLTKRLARFREGAANVVSTGNTTTALARTQQQLGLPAASANQGEPIQIPHFTAILKGGGKSM